MSEKGLSITFGLEPNRPEPALNIENRFIGWVDRIEFEFTRDGQALVVKKFEVRAGHRMAGTRTVEEDIPLKYRNLIDLKPRAEHGVVHFKVEKDKKHG